MESDRLYEETSRRGGLFGKIIAPLEKSLNKIKWGEYSVDELFRVCKISHKLFKENTFVDAEYPVYSSDSANNGIVGYTNKPDFVCNKETPIYITFGDHTRTFNIANKSFSVLDNVKVLIPHCRNVKCLLFIIVAWKKKIPNLGYSRHWKVAKDCKINLPQNSLGEIDFDFMDRFVCKIEELRLYELETLRLHKLNAYLLATDLKNYQLTSTNRRALNCFKNIQWKEFKIGDLFERIDTKKLHYKAKDLPQKPSKTNTLPCLTSSFINQGLNYYAPREGATILSNVISIPSNSDVYRAYYQPNEFTVLSDAYAIRWKDKKVEITPKQYQFMVTCINKVTNLPIYSYKNKLGGWNVVKDKFITLPITADEQPDLEVMERLVSAMQKNVVADVSKYTTHQIDVFRHILEYDHQQWTEDDLLLQNS